MISKKFRLQLRQIQEIAGVFPTSTIQNYFNHGFVFVTLKQSSRIHLIHKRGILGKSVVWKLNRLSVRKILRIFVEIILDRKICKDE